MVPRAGHDALPLRPEGRPAAPRALAGARTGRDDARRLRAPRREPSTLEVGFGISPGLSIDYDDRPTTAPRCWPRSTRCSTSGVRWSACSSTTSRVRPGLGAEHAALTTWLRDHLDDRAELVLVPHRVHRHPVARPTSTTWPPACPTDVPIGWTGATVVCDTITAAEAEARAAALGGRPPLLWDNYPVNDAIMADRLFLGPVRGT